MTVTARPVEDLLRELAPQVLGAVVRRYGHFDLAEEAVQDAMLAAVRQWSSGTTPDDPRAWLIRVASRRLIDQLRSEEARRRREGTESVRSSTDTVVTGPTDQDGRDHDDSLTLLLLCCHPVLSGPSQVALTLRAVGGLTTEQIARAFLVPDSTMGQRISRAKRTLRDAEVGFELPAPEALGDRVRTVLHVLYLIFNEGYTATSGGELQRVDLAEEAIRLARLAQRLLPDDAEVAGLLALLLLTHARREARTDAAGLPVPMAEQDRSRWDAAMIAEGTHILDTAMTTSQVGPYQLQAAIAAVHDQASTADATDWVQVLGLYELLESLGDNPVVTLNRAVAVAMVHGPVAGLRLLETLADDRRVADHARLDVVRGHLLELAGDVAGAEEALRRAARASTNVAEQRYLLVRANRVAGAAHPGHPAT